MSETRFTKGPWEIRSDIPYSNGRVVFHGRWEENVTVCRLWHSNKDTQEANANLIAAAPEMYEALMQAKEFTENLQLPDAEWSRVLDCIVAALAKAAPPEALGRPLGAA